MTKTVALADDAYDALARMKRPGQSFSDVVRDLVQRRKPSIRDVLSGPVSADEDAYWTAFKKERREARLKVHARVDLGD